ncbi:MAG: hypothetical protein EBZ77_08540 [Chitinophagia bacterium]|nr:hypothetical protein [Chitinophagia bacterium]
MNMHRVFYLLLGLLWVTANVRAQEVIYSAYDKFDYRNSDYSVVGMVNGELYTFQNSPEGATLACFDDSMNKLAIINLDFFPHKIYSSRFFPYNDHIVVLYQALEGNKRVQYVALLNEKGLLIGRPQELGTVKTGLFGPVKSVFTSTISEDKKTILVYTLDDKNGGIELDGRWLNDSGRLLRRAKIAYKKVQYSSTLNH